MAAGSSIHSTLLGQGYVQTAQFGFNELIGAVRQGFAERNIYTASYRGLLLLFFVFPLGLSTYYSYQGLLSFGTASLGFLGGLAITFLLVPLHELIHGMLFRYYGARQVRYGMVPRYLMFYAVAHLFIANYRQYRWIGLAPCVLISAACLLSLIWLAPVGQLVALGTLFFHTFCCAGDFGLCSYMYSYRHRDILTFDDAEGKTTWFYCRAAH